MSLQRRKIVAALGSLVLSSPAWAAEGPPAVDASSLIRLIVGLAVVLGLIIGLSFMLRRMGGISTRAGGQLKVLTAVSVGNREKVVLLQIGKQQLLVGVAPGRVQTLHVLEEPITGTTPEAGHEGKSPFAHKLRQAMQRQTDEKR